MIGEIDVPGVEKRSNRLDASKPDGAPRKTLDGSALAALGWTAKTPLADALAATYRAFLADEAAR